MLAVLKKSELFIHPLTMSTYTKTDTSVHIQNTLETNIFKMLSWQYIFKKCLCCDKINNKIV